MGGREKVAYKKLGLKNNTVLDETHIAHIEDGITSLNEKLDEVEAGAVTITGIRESTDDGGSNVITFSDGSRLTIKNGSKGSTGATGATGATGSKGDKGDTGDKGDKGDSITITSVQESQAGGTDNVITFSDGTKVNVRNGYNGANGRDGRGIASIEYQENFSSDLQNVYLVTYSDGTDEYFYTYNGQNGKDGESIQAAVSDNLLKEGKFYTHVVFSDGSDFWIPHGSDGFSPIVNVTEITDGHRVSITDAIGTKTFDVMDGADGGGSGGGSADVMSDTEFADLLDDMAL